MNHPVKLLRPLVLALMLVGASHVHAADWRKALEEQVEKIDQDTPGSLGVYIKRLDNGEAFEYQADRAWYLGSTVKVPIAIAVMQEIEAGKHTLTEIVTLKATDKVDGSGNVVWQDNGESYTIDALLKRMLAESDNTAANMLIRTIGEDTLDQRARNLLGRRGFKQLTDFAQVRYDVYSEFHPTARDLPNLDLVKIAAAPMGPQRVTALSRMLNLQKADLQVDSMDEAYANYYKKGLNAATLAAYGDMLEKLVTGKLFKDPRHQKELYTDMKYEVYDAYRLEAGLPKTVRFIHKTGTQHRRACHMGVISPQDNGRNAIVVVTCAEELDEAKEAEQAFKRIGQAITRTMLSASGN